MLYNKEHNRYVDENGKVFKQTKTGLKLCNQHDNGSGYKFVSFRINNKIKNIYVHRLVWETFKGSIPDGFEIDHIDTDRSNNKLENLRCVNHKDNINNEKTISKKKISMLGNTNGANSRGIVKSEFGIKFKKHFGITRADNVHLYNVEYGYYKNHNHKCSWE